MNGMGRIKAIMSKKTNEYGGFCYHSNLPVRAFRAPKMMKAVLRWMQWPCTAGFQAAFTGRH